MVNKMPESIQHQQLVQVLKIEVQAIVPPTCWSLIQIDTPDSLNLPPQTNEGYRPDVYYQFEKLLVIGDAKTENDVETRHSRAQYESFLNECAGFHGQAFMIMIVPLLDQALANNILRNLKKKIPGDYEIMVKGWIGGAL